MVALIEMVRCSLGTSVDRCSMAIADILSSGDAGEREPRKWPGVTGVLAEQTDAVECLSSDLRRECVEKMG